MKEWNKESIISNINKIFRTGDINYLSKQTYHFLITYTGFIAHYDINGFKSTYQDVDRFAMSIARNYNVVYANTLKKEGKIEGEILSDICTLAKEHDTPLFIKANLGYRTYNRKDYSYDE
jgi:hypothetical protein